MGIMKQIGTDADVGLGADLAIKAVDAVVDLITKTMDTDVDTSTITSLHF